MQNPLNIWRSALDSHQQPALSSTDQGRDASLATADTPLRKSVVELNPFTLLDNQQVHLKHQNDKNKMRKVASLDASESIFAKHGKHQALFADTKKKIAKNKHSSSQKKGRQLFKSSGK
jgi:hypothetical protein